MKTLISKILNYVYALSSTYSIPHMHIYSILAALSLLIIDYFNHPSYLIIILSPAVFFLSCICILIIICIYLKVNRFDKLLEFNSINTFDHLALIGLESLPIYIILHILSNITAWYKINISIVIISFLLFCIYKRATYCNISTITTSSNLLDLKDIYDGHVNVDYGLPILVQEKDVNYDLFNRKHITNQLYRSITYVEADTSYVISLEGPWGSGKTTILNNTKKLLPNNYLIIDNFEPWLYGSEEALLTAMHNALLSHLDITFKPFETLKTLNTLSKLIADEHIVGNVLLNAGSFLQNPNDSISDLKRHISNLILESDKKIIFFIDNLDRANDENIVFLFKIISLIFDLPRVIYVLSFDRERINCVLENTNEFNTYFTEKIIQQEITIYPVEKEQLKRVYTKCIINLLSAYNVPLKNMNEYNTIINFISENTTNIRSFKRCINSVFTQVFSESYGLYQADLLAIELIRFYNPKLYTEIHNNRMYFISYESDKIEAIQTNKNLKDFNTNGATFLNQLLLEHSKYEELLAFLFPNVNRHLNDKDLLPVRFTDTSGYNDSVQNSRICNGQCFDLYFSFGSNSYLQITSEILDLTNDLNNCINFTNTDITLCKILLHSSYDIQRVWLNRFRYFLDKIHASRRVDIIHSLLTRVQLLDTSYVFLEYNAYETAILIIRDLILLCSNEETESLLERIHPAYQSLRTIEILENYLKKKSRVNSKQIVHQLNSLHAKMCQDILDNKINIFSTNYYLRYNSKSLYDYCEKTDISHFQKYIDEMLTKENIYKILADILDETISGTYNYILRKNDFDKYFLHTNKINSIIESATPFSDAERFLHSMYQAFIKRDTAKEDYIEFSRDVPIIWKL